MKVRERISKALNIPVEQVDVTVIALQDAFEINRKRRSFHRIANILAAIITKQSTARYNQNDIDFASDWIADKLPKRSINIKKTT
jgi:hypothetical protein